MASRTKQAGLGFITDLGGNALLIVVSFIAAPIILRLTSESLYGFWITTLSIIGYLALTDLGLGISLTRLVAGLTGSQDAPTLSRLVSTAFFSFCAAGLIFLAVGISFAPFIAVWFKIPPTEAAQVIPAYLVAVLSGAIALPLSIFGAIVTGFQRLAVYNIACNTVALLAVGISVGLLFAGVGVAALALASLFAVLAGSLINYFYARHLVPQLKIKLMLVNRTDLRRLLTFGGYFQLGRIANTISLGAANIVISVARGAAMVTPYTFTSKLPLLFSVNIASKLPIAVFPALSQMFAKKETWKIQQIFIQLARYSTRLAIMAGVLVAVANQQFDSLWVGAEYFGGHALNAVFVYWTLQDTIYRGIGVIVYASGELRSWMIASIIEAAITLFLLIMLVGPLGLVGVALGLSVGKTLTTAWYLPYWICAKLNLSVGQFLWKGVLSAGLRCLPGAGFVVLCAIILPTNMGWAWIILVGFVGVLANALSFEGIELAKPSDLPWRERVHRLLTISAKEA